MSDKYLLIPVENIEYAINLLQHLDSLEAKAKMGTYQSLLKNNKPISLSDSDIEKKSEVDSIKKAPIEYDNSESFAWGSGYSEGYKQALSDLKDILK